MAPRAADDAFSGGTRFLSKTKGGMEGCCCFCARAHFAPPDAKESGGVLSLSPFAAEVSRAARRRAARLAQLHGACG